MHLPYATHQPFIANSPSIAFQCKKSKKNKKLAQRHAWQCPTGWIGVSRYCLERQGD